MTWTIYSEEGLQAFEELFLYACPKFITANPPPYRSLPLLAQFVNSPPPEPAQRHVQLFLSDVRNQLSVPTLRSFLKLYTSLDARKLAGFLDEEEEGMVEKMMVLKQASRSISRAGLGGTNAHQGRGAQVPTGESEGGLLDGQTISTSDLDFVINQVCTSLFALIVETDDSRRTWFISPNQPLVDGTLGGSSATPNTPRESTMALKIHRCRCLGQPLHQLHLALRM